MTEIQPPLEFIPPAFNPLLLRLARVILPWWMRFRVGIAAVETVNAEILADLYHEFDRGKTRFLIAFRHPSTKDPFALTSLIWQAVPQAAKKQGFKLRSPVHSHFMYDRGITIWAGEWLGWLFSQLGGTSIERGKLDRLGLKSARELMVSGRFPLAAAPEGATNNHSEIVSPLEPGIAQLGFWCWEDLQVAGRSEEVVIVPIGIQYEYIDCPRLKLEKLLTTLEVNLGLETSRQFSTEELYQRLLRVGEKALSIVEQFYSKFYNQSIPPAPIAEDPNQKIAVRLQNLLEVALQVAEQYFQIKPKGSLSDRCRRLEQAGWNRIYRADGDNLSDVEQGLGNWIAAEASLYMRHMRLVEQFVAVTGNYVASNPTAERFAETLLIVDRFVKTIKGDNAQKLPNLGKQKVRISVGQPLSVSDRALLYRNNRRQAVADLTQDLQTSLEDAIVDSRSWVAAE